jgi:hypothetical protein
MRNCLISHYCVRRKLTDTNATNTAKYEDCTAAGAMSYNGLIQSCINVCSTTIDANLRSQDERLQDHISASTSGRFLHHNTSLLSKPVCRTRRVT